MGKLKLKSMNDKEWDWKGPNEGLPELEKMGFLIGLTFADLFQLQNGGVIKVNPKSIGLVDLPITIFLGGTHEHMAKGMAKHPEAPHKFLDTHGDKKN